MSAEPLPSPVPDADSVFARALGPDFDRLHPMLQQRFGLTSASGVACVGRGVMDRIWHAGPLVRPFLRLGSWRNILVPVRGSGVPFVIENYPYVDRLGRETVSFVRTFELPAARRARFDASMVWSARRSRLIDYLGTHQHLAVELELTVDGRGGLLIRSGSQRFYEGPIGFTFPLALSGVAEVRERYDEADRRFRIEVRVTNRLLGPIFGYRGSFTCEYPPIGVHGVPATVLPRREERRD